MYACIGIVVLVVIALDGVFLALRKEGYKRTTRIREREKAFSLGI
jgi:septation ring formation regulator EzrA